MIVQLLFYFEISKKCKICQFLPSQKKNMSIDFSDLFNITLFFIEYAEFLHNKLLVITLKVVGDDKNFMDYFNLVITIFMSSALGIILDYIQ